MSRVIRWGEESDSSDDDEILPPSVIQSRLVAKQESSDKSQENHKESYRGGYGTKLGYEDHHHRQRSALDHRRRDRSNSSNSGDYRQQQDDRRGFTHSNYKSHLNAGRGQGGNRHANNHHPYRYEPPPPSRDWKEQARQSTLEKYTSVPKHGTSDGSSWMEQRILRQKQREKEENEMREKMQREREEEKKRKKLGQIEALKAALMMKQEDESPREEIKIILKPDRKVVQDENKVRVKRSNASEKMMPMSKAKNSTDAFTTTTSSSPPTLSLAKLSMESSAPSSSLPLPAAALSTSSTTTTAATRPRLKLAPRTKPVPKTGAIERDKKAITKDNQDDKDLEQRSSLALAVEKNKKDSVQVSNKWKSSKDTKSHSEKESSTVEAGNECDDESRTSDRSSSDTLLRGNTRGGHGRGGPGRKGGGRGSKRVHGRGRGGRHHETRGESTSEKGNGGSDGVHPNDSPKTDFNSEATSTSSSKRKQNHKWETQADGSVVLSRVRKDSVSSDRGDTGPSGGRGRGRGKGRGRGRGRGSGPSSDSH